MITGNEPAFVGNEAHNSLSIRQHFASMAMQGILASVEHTENGRHYVNGMNLDVSLIANDAVDCADALIQELNK